MVHEYESLGSCMTKREKCVNTWEKIDYMVGLKEAVQLVPRRLLKQIELVSVIFQSNIKTCVLASLSFNESPSVLASPSE